MVPENRLNPRILNMISINIMKVTTLRRPRIAQNKALHCFLILGTLFIAFKGLRILKLEKSAMPDVGPIVSSKIPAKTTRKSSMFQTSFRYVP